LAAGIFLAVSLIAAAAAQGRPAAVQRIAVSEANGVTQIAIALSHATEYDIVLLDEPNRLLVSFTRAQWGVRGAGAGDSAGVVAGYRPPPADADRARVVLDLGEPARVKRTRFVPGARRPAVTLVIELEPVSLDAFRALVGPWSPSTPPDPRTVPRPPTQLAAVPGRGAAPRAAAAPRPEPRSELPMILLDPGHGGSDPGASGRNGSVEKTVVLAIARELRRQLEASRRYRVAMTRDGDEFIALRDRLALARAYDADLFISLHADSIRHEDVRGVSVYTLSDSASDEEAAALAQRENRADLIAGVDLSRAPVQVASILIDLARRETMNHSVRLARTLVREIGRDHDMLPTNPHRFAGFAVLRAPDVPSVLIELGYLSNRADERRLASVAYRRELARGVVRAIDQYFVELNRNR